MSHCKLYVLKLLIAGIAEGYLMSHCKLYVLKLLIAGISKSKIPMKVRKTIVMKSK